MSRSLEALDPEVRRFVEAVCAESARLSAGRTLDWVQKRPIAEIARQPWRTGGPVMADTREEWLRWSGGDFRIRLYRPVATNTALPAIVYLHGGGWSIFSIDTHDRLMREYAHATGAVVVGVDYALSPEHRYPIALEQSIDTVRWLREHADELRIDASRLALAGDSAGANLALSTALSLRDENSSRGLCALLLNYGGFDTEISEHARATLGTSDDMLSGEEMDAFWNSYLGEDARHRQDPLAVPMRASLHDLPPAFLVMAERDVLSEQSLRMTELLRAQGNTATLRRYPGASHSFLEAMSISALARRAIEEGAGWLREQLEVDTQA
ncbi:alpha/beta hydrolase [Pseudoxanthomonas sp. CF125]|uniref:alpha/beta hydrolase n=1 Tax=Pseudoxanthomonas sp. CF125 TaxID=1855303 RepID=UPI0008814E5A|nr:alpha/beta hydrolase [Pseudoxanthomonas sp. CF125]SDR14512.1 acetyl esterase [Pseudoxanthomonas sp. CF125]